MRLANHALAFQFITATRDLGGADLDRARTGSRRSLLLGAEHQLRQPLNAVNLLIGELSQGVSGRARDDVLADMRYAVSLSNQWLDALVELEKADQGALSPQAQDVALSEVFLRLKEDFARRFADQGLDLRVVRTTQFVRSDPVFLKRILSLLLDNAAKFTREGKVLLGCRRMGGMIRVEVWDTGLGIAADEWLRVFDPYVRLDNEVRPRERGLGVGLPLARRLAVLSGEQLEISSKLGKGSCFSLTLRGVDRNRPQVPLAQERSGVPRNPLDKAKILLLEGDDAALLSNQFDLWGATVQQVAATRSALAHGLEQEPALVVADGLTFEACGGWDLLSAARQARPEAPGLILLGDAPGGAILPEGETPFHLLSRPIKPARLRALTMFALTAP